MLSITRPPAATTPSCAGKSPASRGANAGSDEDTRTSWSTRARSTARGMSGTAQGRPAGRGVRRRVLAPWPSCLPLDTVHAARCGWAAWGLPALSTEAPPASVPCCAQAGGAAAAQPRAAAGAARVPARAAAAAAGRCSPAATTCRPVTDTVTSHAHRHGPRHGRGPVLPRRPSRLPSSPPAAPLPARAGDAQRAPPPHARQPGRAARGVHGRRGRAQAVAADRAGPGRC